MMMRISLGAICLLALSLGWAAPLQSDKGWAIYPQLEAVDWETLTAENNVALNKVVTARPDPNDRHTSSDLSQLTDGVLAGREGRMWTDQRAVGWGYQDYVRLQIDLGEPQPVERILIRLQVINAENTLPRQISVGLSMNGDYFFPARNLIEKIHPEDDPGHSFEPVAAEPPGIYAVELQAGYQARYVRLDFTTRGYLIVDEVAVIAGEGAVEVLPPPPTGEPEYYDNVFDRRDQYQKMIAPGNLLAGRRLHYSPTPTQYLNVDDDDPLQLTDGSLGERVDERIWFERGCVGWQGPSLVTIFADLEQIEPIDSVVIRLLGGGEQNSLEFPDEIKVLLSTDGNEYYEVAARHKRGLDDLSDEAWDLPEEKLAWVHNFRIPAGFKARYVALQIRHQKQFIVSDEMAVVKGADDLAVFTPAAGKLVSIVSSGVAFTPVWGKVVSVCQNLPLRARLAIQDAREGAASKDPCYLVIDVPETLKFVLPEQTPEKVTHEGREFQRYRVKWVGEYSEFYLQSQLPAGQTDVLYTFGDSGEGPENERQIRWESIYIPPARVPQRLHVSLSWAEAPQLFKVWPNYLEAQRHLGFNAVGMQPCYWSEEKVPEYREILAQIRAAGFQLIQIESPAGAISRDRQQEEIKSVLPEGKTGHVCPAYRGQYYQKEHASFAQATVWIDPDIVFYDIEAYWHGAQESPRCSRCQQRYERDGFTGWDEFWAAMGREIHVDMKAAIDEARATAGLTRPLTYGSYRTEPRQALNDGLFSFENTYPELLQMAMPSLYVAGNRQAVAVAVAAIRSKMQTNDIVPWLTTGCYGDFDPAFTRDMILESFANGARGITYYWYGHFDAAHFKYHAEAVDLVAPLEDLFMDGQPLTGLQSDNDKIKLCGMGTGNEQALLVSNYQGIKAGTNVSIQTPATGRTAVWDVQSGQQLGWTSQQGAFTLTLDGQQARLLYLGTKYAAAIKR